MVDVLAAAERSVKRGGEPVRVESEIGPLRLDVSAESTTVVHDHARPPGEQ